MADDTQSFSANKKDKLLTPQILVLGEVPAPISLWQELQNSSAAEPWLLGNTALDLLSSWVHLQRFVPSSIDQKLWQELNELVRQDAAKLIDSVTQLRPLSDFSQRAEAINRVWDGVADEDETEPLTDAVSQLFYLLDNTSLVLVACDKLRNCSQPSHLLALEPFRKDVEAAEEYFAENAEQFLCAARWASWMLEAYRPDLDEDPLLWETTLKYGRLEETFESLHTIPSPATPLPIREMAAWLKTELEADALATQPQHMAENDEVARRPAPLEGTVVPLIEEMMEHLAEAFRRQFRPEAMLAKAANSDKKKEVKVLWDSKQDLAPLRCIVYRERNGDLRLDFSSTDDTHENQTFEVIVKEQTRPTVTFRRDPETRELYGEARISRDELPEADLSKLTFRLKKS